jgi:uncharacterized protein (TIGR03435 family)
MVARVTLWTCAVWGASAQPQASRPQFEVASIHPSAPGNIGAIRWLSGDRFSASKSTVMNLITYAFETPAPQVTGAPAWLTSDRFDISAKPETAIDGTPETNLHQVRSIESQKSQL